MTDRSQLSRIRDLFLEALGWELDTRKTRLVELCQDEDVLREVESLLAAHDQSGIVDRLEEDVVRPMTEAQEIDPIARGTELSRYRVVDRVGGGGMGIVYRALDIPLDRMVALKVLHPHLQAAPGANRKLLQEARAAASLDHRNICTIHEVAEVETPAGRHVFIAMALYEGQTLKDRIHARKLTIPEAIGVALQVARALEHAHSKGVVHKDIKPANILLTPEGDVKLVDFGLATVKKTGGRLHAWTGGTAAYMSPEQIDNERVDYQTDLWSLGVVLYECLAGRRPFLGDSHLEIREAIRCREPDPLSRLRPSLPLGLDSLVELLLNKDPGERPDNAGETVKALKQVAAKPVLGRFPDSHYRRIGWTAGVGLLGLAIALGAVLYLPDPPTASTRSELESRPTEDSEAYQAYLEGRYYQWGRPDYSAENWAKAIAAFGRATELDPDFLLAWCELAQTHSIAVHFGVDDSGEHLRQAELAIEQASEIAPNNPQVFLARGQYYYMALKENEKALAEYARVEKWLKDDPELYEHRGFVLRRMGRYGEAVDAFRRAVQLDPRGARFASHLAVSLSFQRNYDEALRYHETSILAASQAPRGYLSKVETLWSAGAPLPTARAVLESIPKDVQREDGVQVTWFWQELYEGSPEQALQRISRVPRDWFTGTPNLEPKPLLAAVALEARGSTERARGEWLRARGLLKAALAGRVKDYRTHNDLLTWLAIVELSLGNAPAGIAKAERAVEALPVSVDTGQGAVLLERLALCYLWSGQISRSLEIIDQLLSIPSRVSLPYLRLDPRWKALVEHPTFQTLVNKHGQ